MQGEAEPPFRLQNFTIKEAADSTRLFTRFPGSLVKEALCQIKSFLYLILQGLGGLEGMLFLFGTDPSRPQWSDSNLGYHCLGNSRTCWVMACRLPLILNIEQAALVPFHGQGRQSAESRKQAIYDRVRPDL